MFRLLSVLLAFGAFAASAADLPAETCPLPAGAKDEWQGQHAWTAIEQAGLRIGHIQIDVTDVYESSEAWYAAGANWLHVQTRDQVIRDLVLIRPDDKVDARVVYESARRLRALGFFREVSILPIGCHDGVVDLRIEAKDAWTLIVSLKANRAGGQNSTGLKLEDRNFLGTGKEVYIETESDATRTSVNYAYDDPALFGSRWRLALLHKDQSDGRSNEGALVLPFLSAKQAWGFEARSADTVETLSFYQYGELAWQAPSTNQLNTAVLWRLIDRDVDSGWRAGIGVRSEVRDYGAPIAVDPTLRPVPDLAPFSSDGITFAISRFHDRFVSFRNLKLVDKTEDINLGLDATLALTVSPESFGNGGEEGTRLDLDATWAARPRAGWLLQLELEGHMRNAQEDWRDGLLSTSFTAYKQDGRHTRLARLGLDWRDDPDPEHEASLGGDEGMLGYPADWLVGDRIFQLHLEDRWSTDQVLFQTLRVGYTVIAEVGTGRRIGTREWSKTLADIGAGLRLGNLRGAYGQVIYITAFVPLVREPGVDNWQLVIGDIISF